MLGYELERSETDRFKAERTINIAMGNDVMLQINSRELSAGVTTVAVRVSRHGPKDIASCIRLHWEAVLRGPQLLVQL